MNIAHSYIGYLRSRYHLSASQFWQLFHPLHTCRFMPTLSGCAIIRDWGEYLRHIKST